jgi:hypothetical protein
MPRSFAAGYFTWDLEFEITNFLNSREELEVKV